MGATAAHSRTAARASTLASLLAVGALAGCGGGGQSQDKLEPSGNFPVTVVSASFPSNQHLAKRSTMQIAVRNDGSKTIPDISVTVKCPNSGLGGGFDQQTDQVDVADSRRPVFVLDRIPSPNGGAHRPPLDPAPLERSSAYVETYPLGPLASGRMVTFRWDVAAVKAGPYRLCWHVNAGFAGKAKAVATTGSPPITGEFDGTVSNTPPQASIAPDQHTVIRTPGG